ncbi:MAG: hypothetical protein WBQ78_15430, partial [Gammaproteobacteria bacterium]
AFGTSRYARLSRDCVALGSHPQPHSARKQKWPHKGAISFSGGGASPGRTMLCPSGQFRRRALYLSKIETTESIGISTSLPRELRTVVALSSALCTASSVASMVAANSGFMAELSNADVAMGRSLSLSSATANAALRNRTLLRIVESSKYMLPLQGFCPHADIVVTLGLVLVTLLPK